MPDLIDLIRQRKLAPSLYAKAEQYVCAAATTGTSRRFFITSDKPTAWRKNPHSGGAMIPALRLHAASSFTAGGRRQGYTSLESHKLWNVRIPCILIEYGTLNGCGNSAT